MTFRSSNGWVDELLARMSLAEKLGQLVQVQPRRAPNMAQRIRAGPVGSIFGVLDVSELERYQRIARDETRLGIPLLVGNDVILGYRTVFPIPLPKRAPGIFRFSRAATREARAKGTDCQVVAALIRGSESVEGIRCLSEALRGLRRR